MAGGIQHQGIDWDGILDTYFRAQGAAEARNERKGQREFEDRRIKVAEAQEKRQAEREAREMAAEENRLRMAAAGGTAPGEPSPPPPGTDNEKRRRQFEFNAAQQVLRDPSAADRLEADAESIGAQVPGYRVQVAGDERPIEVPPDVVAARGSAEAAGVKVNAPSAEDLRKELQSSPAFKAAQEIKTARLKVIGAPKNSVGDMSRVYGLMKLQDPGSTVREGEYATAESLGGVSSKIGALYNKLVGGGSLTDAQRREIETEAGRLYRAQRTTLDPQLEQYRGLATSAGVAPEQVVLDIWGDQPQSRPRAIANEVAAGADLADPALPPGGGQPQGVPRQAKPQRRDPGGQPAPIVVNGTTPKQRIDQILAEGKLSPQGAVNKVRAEFKLSKDQAARLLGYANSAAVAGNAP
jgi:hypothetical protein